VACATSLASAAVHGQRATAGERAEEKYKLRVFGERDGVRVEYVPGTNRVVGEEKPATIEGEVVGAEPTVKADAKPAAAPAANAAVPLRPPWGRMDQGQRAIAVDTAAEGLVITEAAFRPT
jgi:hypothetical protein